MKSVLTISLVLSSLLVVSCDRAEPPLQSDSFTLTEEVQDIVKFSEFAGRHAYGEEVSLFTFEDPSAAGREGVVLTVR